MLGTAIASVVGAAAMSTAIITTDQTALRAAPRDSALQQAQLRQGEVVEIRGERQDYLQVWDHQRERGGFVRASDVRRTALEASEAPDLLAVLRFVRDTPGSEALGIGLAAAYLKAAPVQALQGQGGVEAFDALGTAADRLARRASSSASLSKGAEATLSAHLDVAARYGVRFHTYEREGRMQVCYDGEAFRRVLAMNSGAEPRARAALALTRPECLDPALRPLEQKTGQEWRAEVLDRVDPAALPGYLMNRVQLRRAGVWSSLAYQRARLGEAAQPAAERALAALAAVNKSELAEEDVPGYNDAAMRTNASRWAALPAVSTSPVATTRGLGLVSAPGQPGETCVALVDAKNDVAKPLARRCTHALVWLASASVNREGTALALAVQPMEAWRELWVFRKEAGGWVIEVLPPAATVPELGYAEFAGWVPGGLQMLVAREARGEGKYRRNYELLRLSTLAAERQAGDPNLLGAFQRWQDAAWKHQSVSVR
ncbi:MAG TPA: hypothetical protein VLJ57_00960 [Burkholderiaceae bacterium]|nr:hypothetical protein [Burkholderiaceae bacterium]